MLTIRVLGDMTVLREGEAAELPPSRKTRALLAYLAIVDRPQRRERLCEMFWDIPDDPRGALRWSLSKIRQIIGPENAGHLKADRNTVCLDAGALDIDAAPLIGMEARALEALDTDRLEDLASRFRGLFLDDLALPRCPEFEAWRRAIANELEVKRLRLLRLLVDRLSDDPQRALRHAQTLLAMEPDDAGLRVEIARLAEAARQSALAQGSASPSIAAPQRPALAQEVRYCTTPDGMRLAYALSGDGVPIIRAAHWMSHLELDWKSPVWRPWTEALSAKHTYVRYDQRGNGLSDSSPSDVSFDAMVADLEAIVDATGFQRFYLLGLSQGCAASIAYAVRHPEKVIGLVLYGGFAKGWRKRGSPAEMERREAMGALMRLGWGQKDPVFRQMFTSAFIPEASQEQRDWFNELQRQTVSPEVAHAIFEATSQIDVEPLLPAVRVPTLVMHSTRDAAIPFASGEQIAAAIPGARFVALESANHILLGHEQAFETFVAETLRFVSDPEITLAERLPAPVGEIGRGRRTVTMLSAEIVSPMHVFEFDDPEVSAGALRPLQDRLVATIEAHDGTVSPGMDGTLMAAFGLEAATEDHAYLACRAALAARKAVEEASQGTARLRVGLDTGDVIVGAERPRNGGPFEISGSAPRTASRLMRALRHATIASTARARAAAGGYVRMRPLPREDCPQIGRDERAYELLGENEALSRWHLRAHRGLTELVGREVEMKVLQAAWRRAREGHGQIVGIVGDPGLGKSRLTHEFIASPEVASFQVLEAGALEFERRTPLGLMKKLFLAACGIDVSEELAAARQRLLARLGEIGLSPDFLSPLAFLADMAVEDEAWNGLDAREKTSRAADALRAFLVTMSRRAPLAVLFEDLHWIDPESEMVFNRLAEGVAASRLLLIVTHRPEYEHLLGRRGTFQQIRLESFVREEARQFLARLLGDDPSLWELGELLVEQAEGSPLYLEEMVRALVERGALEGKPGSYRLAGTVASIDVPASVQSLVAARINQLGSAERQVLQLAAVIGRNVPGPLLKALAPVGPIELAQALARLQTQEFLFEVQQFPQPEYMFKHAVTQRVAYDGILAEDRKRLHSGILGALESLNAGALNHFVETLAEHAIRAEEWDAAARYAMEAARRAEERCAYRGAARFLEDAARALSMLPKTPETMARRIDVAMAMRPAFGALGEYEKAAGPLAEARLLAEELGDRERLYEVLLHQSYLNSTYGGFAEALEPAETMKASALVSGTSHCVAEADLAAAQALLLRSASREVVERLAPHREGYLGEWRRERFGQMGIRSVWYLGHMAQAHARLGQFDPAEEAVARARELAEEAGRPIDRYAVVYFAGLVDMLRGPTREMIATMREHADADGFGGNLFIRGWILSVLGHAEFLAGETETACETLEQAIGFSKRLRLVQSEIRARAVLGWARARLGLPEAAANLGHALEVARERGDPWSEILGLRGLAELKPSRGSIAFLEQARDIARRIELMPELAAALEALGQAKRRARQPGADECLAEAGTLCASMGLRVPAAEAAAIQAVSATI